MMKDIVFICFFVLPQIVFAGIPDEFIPIDSSIIEMRHDIVNGSDITEVSCSFTAVFPGPDRNVWCESDNFILLESDLERPQGTSSGSGERQLIAISLSTGEAYWITSLEVEDSFIYGTGHFDMPAKSHFVCSRENDLVAYRDITGHHLYLKRLTDDTTIELLNILAGTFIGAPSINDDGSIVIIEMIHNGKNNDYYDGTTHSVVRIDIDIANLKILGTPQIIESYTNRKVNSVQLAEKLGIPVLSSDGNWIAFCNKQEDVDGNVSYAVRYCKSDGAKIAKVTDGITVAGGLYWYGNDLYFVADSVFSRTNINGSGYQKWRKISNAEKLKGKIKTQNESIFPVLDIGIDNITVNGTEILYNTMPVNYDSDGLGTTAIYCLDTLTADKSLLAYAKQNQSDNKINFHISNDKSKVAYIDFNGSTSKICIITF